MFYLYSIHKHSRIKYVQLWIFVFQVLALTLWLCVGNQKYWSWWGVIEFGFGIGFDWCSPKRKYKQKNYKQVSTLTWHNTNHVSSIKREQITKITQRKSSSDCKSVIIFSIFCRPRIFIKVFSLEICISKFWCDLPQPCQ